LSPFFSKEGQELFHSFKVERKNKVTVTAQILTSKVQHYSTPGSVPKQKAPGHGEATRLSNEKHILARAATSFGESLYVPCDVNCHGTIYIRLRQFRLVLRNNPVDEDCHGTIYIRLRQFRFVLETALWFILFPSV
jgi:hypothetical protein